MPNKATVFRWLAQHAEFRDQYAQATETRADAIFEEMFDIADEVEEEAAAVSKARLCIDTRKWALARMNPKKYGDKVSQEIDHKSSNGNMATKPTTIQLLPVEPRHEGNRSTPDPRKARTTIHCHQQTISLLA